MAKSIDELATDITCAWLAAMGGGETPTAGRAPYLDKDRVAQFYETIHETITKMHDKLMTR